MIKRFNIQPDAANRPRSSDEAASEYPSNENRQNESNEKTVSQSVKLWLLGGLCAGLALGLFTKRR